MTSVAFDTNTSVRRSPAEKRRHPDVLDFEHGKDADPSGGDIWRRIPLSAPIFGQQGVLQIVRVPVDWPLGNLEYLLTITPNTSDLSTLVVLPMREPVDASTVSYPREASAGSTTALLADWHWLPQERGAILDRFPDTTRLTPAAANSELTEASSGVLEDVLRRVIAAAADEDFDLGKTSQLAVELERLANRNRLEFWRALRRRVAADRRNGEALADILRWAGTIDDPRTVSDRLALMSDGLKHPLSIVRDGAAIGLEHMGGADAAKLLWQAIAVERIKELREDMILIVKSLERTAGGVLLSETKQ